MEATQALDMWGLLDIKEDEAVQQVGYLSIQSRGEEQEHAIKTGVNVVGRKNLTAEGDRLKAQEWDAQFVDHAVSGIFLDDASISATHAAVYVERGGAACFVKDLGSTNKSAIKRQGAWLLLTPQDRYELTSGDSVRLGAVDCQIHFVAGGADDLAEVDAARLPLRAGDADVQPGHSAHAAQVQDQEGVQAPGSTVGSLLDDILRGDVEEAPTATGSQPGLYDATVAPTLDDDSSNVGNQGGEDAARSHGEAAPAEAGAAHGTYVPTQDLGDFVEQPSSGGTELGPQLHASVREQSLAGRMEQPDHVGPGAEGQAPSAAIQAAPQQAQRGSQQATREGRKLQQLPEAHDGLDFSDGDDVWPGGVEATAVVEDVALPSDKASDEPAADDGCGPSQQARSNRPPGGSEKSAGDNLDEDVVGAAGGRTPLQPVDSDETNASDEEDAASGRVSNPQSAMLSDSSGWRKKKQHLPEPQEIDSAGAGLEEAEIPGQADEPARHAGTSRQQQANAEQEQADLLPFDESQVADTQAIEGALADVGHLASTFGATQMPAAAPPFEPYDLPPTVSEGAAEQALVKEGEIGGPAAEAAKVASEAAGGPPEAIEQLGTGEQGAGKLESSEAQQLRRGEVGSKSQAQGPPSREHSEYSFRGTGEDPNAMDMPQPDIPAARASARRRGRGRDASGRSRGRGSSPRRRGRSRLAPSDIEKEARAHAEQASTDVLSPTTSVPGLETQAAAENLLDINGSLQMTDENSAEDAEQLQEARGSPSPNLEEPPAKSGTLRWGGHSRRSKSRSQSPGPSKAPGRKRAAPKGSRLRRSDTGTQAKDSEQAAGDASAGPTTKGRQRRASNRSDVGRSAAKAEDGLEDGDQEMPNASDDSQQPGGKRKRRTSTRAAEASEPAAGATKKQKKRAHTSVTPTAEAKAAPTAGKRRRGQLASSEPADADVEPGKEADVNEQPAKRAARRSSGGTTPPKPTQAAKRRKSAANVAARPAASTPSNQPAPARGAASHAQRKSRLSRRSTVSAADGSEDDRAGPAHGNASQSAGAGRKSGDGTDAARSSRLAARGRSRLSKESQGEQEGGPAAEAGAGPSRRKSGVELVSSQRKGVAELAAREAALVRVLFSKCVSEQDRKKHQNTIEQLGGSVVKDDQFSHFVTLPAARGKKDRGFVKSLNTLLALAAGKPIVHDGWLTACAKAGAFVEPSQYLLHDAAAEDDLGFSLSAAHAKAQEQLLLEGYSVLITPGLIKAENASLKDKGGGLKALVQAAGGLLVERVPAHLTGKLAASGERWLILGADQAKKEKDWCRKALGAGIKVHARELLTGNSKTKFAGAVLKQELDVSKEVLFET